MHPRHTHPPLALKYLQAAIEATFGERPVLLDAWLHPWSPDDLVREALARDAGVAIVAASSMCIEEAVAVGEALRRAGVCTIAVGQHVSHAAHHPPARWCDAFEFAILGDPELETIHLLQRLRATKSREELRRHYRRRLVDHEPFVVPTPDDLPRPAFTADEMARYPFPFPVRGHRLSRWGYTLTAWGCPYACNHCTEVTRKTTGTRLRARSAVKVVDEVEALLEAGAQGIVFEDDTLFCDRDHLLGLCAEIEDRGLRFPWIAHARADELDTEVVVAARRSGAALLKIGVESGSQHVIERLGKAPNGRDWISIVEGAFDRLRAHRIATIAMFMVGSPDEDVRDVERSIDLALRLDADYIQVQIFCAYPDVRHFARLDDPLAADAASRNLSHYAPPAWTFSRIPPEDLQGIQMDFYRRFYLRPGFVVGHLGRCWRHYLRPNTALLGSALQAMRVARSR